MSVTANGAPHASGATRKGSARKEYAAGSEPSIRVPYREIALTNGETHAVYDTSGPHGDPIMQSICAPVFPRFERHGSNAGTIRSNSRRRRRSIV